MRLFSKRNKDTRVLPMTSAPTGAGKTTLLYILCELFRHKWNVSKFMEVHLSSKNCGEEIEEDFIQTMTSILNDPVIIKLRNATDLSSSLLESTHTCFIGFNSGTPINDFELKYFANQPKKIIISRVIFAHMSYRYDPSDYYKFFCKNFETLKRIESLEDVLLFFRNRSGCKHFLLAIDAIIHLDRDSKGIQSSPIQNAISAIADTVISIDGIHAIISSTNSSPFKEYIKRSRHTPHFVRLPPLLENLERLCRLLAKRRNDESAKLPILQLLLSTGGHPRLIAMMVPWLLTVPKEEMDFENAVRYESLFLPDIQSYSEPLRRLIFTGGCIPSSKVGDIRDICGSFGMISRPSNYNSIYPAVVSPLVLHAIIFRRFADRRNAAYLVPFHMSSNEDFGKFIASWFIFQYQLGRSLCSIFNVHDSASSFLYCTELFNLSKQSRLFEFRDKATFMKSLPNIKLPDWSPHPTRRIKQFKYPSGDINDLFGLASPSEGFYTWVVKNQPGFNVMISSCTSMNRVKKVLLVQCKTNLVYTSDEGGRRKEVSSVSSKDFADALVDCSELVKALESNSWEVSFLGLYACNTPESVIPECCPTGVSPAFFERSAAIRNIGMFNLLGDSFGLALELAKKGHNYSLHPKF